MKKRVIIVGAGFSKSLADAPLVNEFVEPIYKAAVEKELSKRIGRTDFESSFIKVVEHLANSIEHGLKFLEKDGTKIKNRSGIGLISSLNIEYLSTFIDLNIERPFIPKGIGVDLQGCPIPFMDNMFVFNFGDAKTFLLNYIIQILLPDSLNIKKGYFKKIQSFFREGDVIITFNYDILLEQILFDAGLWHPFDGYLLGKIDDYILLEQGSIVETKIPIIKLHGSINWQEPGLFDNDITIFVTHPNNHMPFFPGLKYKTKIKRIADKKLLHAFLIFPTFMKKYKSKHELLLLKTAIKHIQNCNEIITLGYSFPEADSITAFMLTQIPENTIIKIIDLKADEIKEKLMKIFSLKNRIVDEKIGICEWLDNDCKFISFRNKIIEQRLIRQLLG